MLLGKEKLGLFCSGSNSLKVFIALHKLFWEKNDYYCDVNEVTNGGIIA